MERRWWGNGRRRSMGRRMVHERRRYRSLIAAERRVGYDQRDQSDRRELVERRWGSLPPVGSYTSYTM